MVEGRSERSPRSTSAPSYEPIGKVTRAKKGLKLDGVRANGLLEALGLREGDVLRRANGRRVARIADLRRALTDLSEGEPIELDLERKGRRVELAYAAR